MEKLLTKERRVIRENFCRFLEKRDRFGEGGPFDLFNYFIGKLRTLILAWQKFLHRFLEEFYQLLAQKCFLPFYLAGIVIYFGKKLTFPFFMVYCEKLYD